MLLSPLSPVLLHNLIVFADQSLKLDQSNQGLSLIKIYHYLSRKLSGPTALESSALYFRGSGNVVDNLCA